MIRRREGDLDLLISMDSHAALAARLAEHFGNERFARPEPRDSLLTAVRLHDHGWQHSDEEPILDESRRPLDVLDAPPIIALKAWCLSADHAATIDPYAGLLVSLHVLALSVRAAARRAPATNPSDIQHLTEQFHVNKFLHREVERQEQLRRQLGLRTDLPLTQGLADLRSSPQEDRLIFLLRLLQTMDAASLLLCGEPEDRIQGIQFQPAPSAEPTPVKFDYDNGGKLRMKPWPFDVKQIELSITARAMHRQTYESVEAFRTAYRHGEDRQVTVSIAPA